MNAEQIASLITVRDFAFRTIDNVLVKMSKEQVKMLQTKLTIMDQQIINAIIELKLPNAAQKQ